MRIRRKARPYHGRDWRRFWRYCRCGFRWVCPDAAERVPLPYEPAPVPPLTAAEFRRAVRARTTDAAIARQAAAVRDAPTDPPRPTNQRPAWNRRTGLLPRLSNGRAGNLTPAQEHRARQAETSRGTERV